LTLGSTRTSRYGDVRIDMTACRQEPSCRLAVEIRTRTMRHSVTLHLGEGGPGWVEAKPLKIAGVTAFSIVAIAVGGSDQHLETSIVAVTDGAIHEALPDHLRTSSQDLVCIGNLDNGRTPALLVATFLWGDEAHYDPHRYTVSQYEWHGQQFSKSSTRMTRQKHPNSRSAIQELGYRCERDLVSWTLGTDVETALEGSSDG
jgi:hypothetical protein